MIEEEGTVAASTSLLAERMGVSGASATSMVKKLHGLGLVEHLPYKGTTLSEPGRRIALEVVRHHRLLETYLSQALGLSWDEVHEEAEVLEHVLSERLEDRISSLLGDPTTDPHGHPIPAKDLTVPDVPATRLWEVAEGSTAEVVQVSDWHAEALRFLAGAGIVPGAVVEVVSRGPLAGPLFVRVVDRAGNIEALSREVAETVVVR
jgi:DtxR family Mn-dependent transcriptional regulator